MKSMIWVGMFVGSTIGAYIPALWGGDLFSFSSVILTAVGGFAGIWVGYQASRW